MGNAGKSTPRKGQKSPPAPPPTPRGQELQDVGARVLNDMERNIERLFGGDGDKSPPPARRH